MRILTVLRDLGPGGTQRSAQNFAIGYKHAGHDSAVLAHHSLGPRADPLEAAGVDLFAPPDPARSRLAVEAAAGWQPDIIHIHRSGRPDSVTAGVLRGLGEFSGRRIPAVETNIFARFDYSDDRNLIDVHLLLTRWCLWKWSRWSKGSRPEPVAAVVPNGIDVDAFFTPPAEVVSDFRSGRGIPEDAFLFGRIGQPAMPKWSRAMLDAFVALQSERAYLMLVGAPRELLNTVAELESSIRSRIIQVDFLFDDEQLRAAYAAMDVFVLAAEMGESFGMVLAESLLCGTPVIALSTPAKDNSQVEVVGHEVGGLVAANTRSITSAMHRMIEDPDLVSLLARRGAERIKQEYSVERACNLAIRIMTAVIESGSRDELRRKLDSDPELTTSVSDDEIEAMLSASIGRPSVADRALMRLVHQPHIYRWYSTLRS